MSPRPLDGMDGGDGRRQIPFRIARPPAIDSPVFHHGAEGIITPGSRVPFGDDIRVGFVQEGFPRAAEIQEGDHIGASGHHLFIVNL